MKTKVLSLNLGNMRNSRIVKTMETMKLAARITTNKVREIGVERAWLKTKGLGLCLFLTNNTTYNVGTRKT